MDIVAVKNKYCLYVSDSLISDELTELSEGIFHTIIPSCLKNLLIGLKASQISILLFDPTADYMLAMDIIQELKNQQSVSAAVICDNQDSQFISTLLNSGIPVFSRAEVRAALYTVYTMFCHIQLMQVQTEKLQTKFDDAKLINRAKILLIQRYKMSEQEAHRYIEKSAMNNGQKRRDIAISIIKAYEG